MEPEPAGSGSRLCSGITVGGLASVGCGSVEGKTLPIPHTVLWKKKPERQMGSSDEGEQKETG